MLQIFLDQLLPVFLAAGAGYALAARVGLDPRGLSHFTFFILVPSFVFDQITSADVAPAELARMVGFAATSLIALGGIAAGVGALLGWPRTRIAALVLVVLLPNAGNYGLSVNLFAFGEAGMTQASLYFVTSAVITATLGVLVASLGRLAPRRALAGLLRVPAIWAVVVASLSMATSWAPPLPIERTVSLLASATIPTMLVLLGVQLYRSKWSGMSWPLAVAVGLRLVGGAGVGILLVGPFGLGEIAANAGIVQSAMPSAIVCIILATEFDAEPDFVTPAVTLSTLLSPLTLTPLLAWLQ